MMTIVGPFVDGSARPMVMGIAVCSLLALTIGRNTLGGKSITA